MTEHYVSALAIGALYIFGAIWTTVALSTDKSLTDARSDRVAVLFAAVFWVFFWVAAFAAGLYDYMKGVRRVD